MTNYFLFVVLPALLLLGIIFGYFLRKFLAAKQIDSAEARAEKLLLEAKTKQKELLLQARDKALQVIDGAKKENESRRQELQHLQARLEKREGLFDQKLIELQEKQQRLYDKASQVERLREEAQKLRDSQNQKLQEIAGLTKAEAEKILLENIEKESQETLLTRMRKLEAESTETIETKAREIIGLATQRCAAPHTAETTTSVIDLPSDEMKGRIIGREGRNIKAIEQLTGVEIIVDDTPETILISGFSPIRRQVAKRALEKLIVDGRIHPGRIEEAVEEAKKEVALDIKKAGEETVLEAGVAGLDPKLIQIIGRLKYRSSYGQNVLQHSLEVSHLAALLASELGADVTIAKKAGLLHDLGKAVDHEVTGTHPELGRDIAKKFNLPEEIITPILTHHEDKPPTIEAVIVKVADAISSSRVGARKETYEQYLQRLEELEKVATSFEGIEKAYAIQAGREIRVFVTPEKIDDLTATKIAHDIAKNIEQTLKYPGEIKVTVIREKRVIEYAR